MLFSSTWEGRTGGTRQSKVRADEERPANSTALQFLQGFLARPREVASVVPSSRYLQNQISSLPCLRDARAVVELGPGTGATTRALLESLSSTARLMSVECLPEFAACVRTISDPRLQVIEGAAQQLTDHLAVHHFPAPDVVISGIPFSTIPPPEGERLIAMIHAHLRPGGAFVAYQLRDRISELASPWFGPPQTRFVPWNIPPLRIFWWNKTDSRGA